MADHRQTTLAAKANDGALESVVYHGADYYFDPDDGTWYEWSPHGTYEAVGDELWNVLFDVLEDAYQGNAYSIRP